MKRNYKNPVGFVSQRGKKQEPLKRDFKPLGDDLNKKITKVKEIAEKKTESKYI